MTFAEAVKTCLFRKYVTFRGRASRSEYWWFTVLTWVLADIPLQFIGALSERDMVVMIVQIPMSVLWAIFVLPIILALFFLLPSLAVTCRRLHDIGRSGWWCLVIVLSLFIDRVSEMLNYPPDYKMVSAVPMVVLLLFLLRKGTNGSNRFGPPPKTGFIP